LTGLFIAVTLFFVVRFFWQLISIMRIHRHSEKRIVSRFNVSQLKKRIMMMNKSKSPTLALAKYRLMLPLIFFVGCGKQCVCGTK